MCVFLFVHVLRKRSRFGRVLPVFLFEESLHQTRACLAELQTRAAIQTCNLNKIQSENFQKFFSPVFLYACVWKCFSLTLVGLVTIF